MTDRLQGSAATFDGGLDDGVFISRDTVLAGALDGDPEAADFIRSIIGTGCPGYYTTKQQALFDSQDAYENIFGGNPFVDPCAWLRYFAPFAFRQNFVLVPQPPGPRYGTWKLFADYVRAGAFHQFDPPLIGCFQFTHQFFSFTYRGAEPTVRTNDPGLHLCNQDFTKYFADEFGNTIYADNNHYAFLPNTDGHYLLSADDNYDDSTGRYDLQGVFVPIPDIPDGYPAPPSAPPLQGQVTQDEISDEDCYAIVTRGKGFQTLWDIGARALVADEGELPFMQQWTESFGVYNTETAPTVVNNMPEIVLDQTTQIVLGRVFSKVVDVGSVIIKKGGLNKITSVLGVAGKIIQTVEIAEELLQEIQMALGQLYVPQCIESDPPDHVGKLRLIPIPFPVQTVDGQSTLNGMQAICDALYALLRCCPPCVQDAWSEGPTFTDVTDWTPGFLPSAVLFEKIQVKYKENASMGGQDKLGYFKWIVQDDENGQSIECQEPIWVNSEQSFFFSKNGLVRGLRWVPQNGVTVKLLYKFTHPDMGLNRLTLPQVP